MGIVIFKILNLRILFIFISGGGVGGRGGFGGGRGIVSVFVETFLFSYVMITLVSNYIKCYLDVYASKSGLAFNV